MHEIQGTSIMIGDVFFYRVSGFDYPVMVLAEFGMMTSDPRYVDTYPILIPYLVKDGVVTGDITEDERLALLSADDATGVAVINGEEIAAFSLIPEAPGAESTDELMAMLQAVQDWLAGQNP